MEGGAMDGIRGANMAGQTDAMYQVIFVLIVTFFGYYKVV